MTSRYSACPDRVAPRERRLDVGGADARHARADVEAVAVEDEPDVSGVARGCAFGRFLLHEVGDRDSAEPDFLVQPAIEADAVVWNTYRLGLLAGAVGRLSGGEGGDTHHQCEEEYPGAGRQ